MGLGWVVLVIIVSGPLATPQKLEDSAPRFWPKYTRKVRLLDSESAWSFGLYLDHLDPLDPKLIPARVATPNATVVPGSFDAMPPGIMGPRGVGVYRRHFTLRTLTPGRLQFGACSFFCRVFVDGHDIGSHKAGGYSMFMLDVPAANYEERELVVIADNRFSRSTAPMHTGGDFWHYGGLLRSVVLHELNTNLRPVVWRAEISTIDVWRGSIEVRVVLSDRSYRGDFELRLDFDQGAGQLGRHGYLC